MRTERWQVRILLAGPWAGKLLLFVLDCNTDPRTTETSLSFSGQTAVLIYRLQVHGLKKNRAEQNSILFDFFSQTLEISCDRYPSILSL